MAHLVPGRFDGKVALLSGASSGIARATALQLAREGAQVFGVDINAEGLDSLTEVAAAAGVEIATHTGSVAERSGCFEAVEACISKFGRLDVLGNIAGVSRADKFCDVTEADYRMMMAVNADGSFFLCQAALPHLLETDGNIINIASNAGIMGTAYTVAYSMTKGAIVQLTKSLAMELSKTRVRVNAIAPGGVTTNLTTNFHMADGLDGDLIMPYVGFRGMAEPEELAGLFAFVASSDGKNMHGSILSSDTGLTCG